MPGKSLQKKKLEKPEGMWSHDVVMMMVTHVDDLAWSDTPESKDVIKYLKSKFPIEKEKTGLGVF